MSHASECPILAFSWRPRNISGSVVEAARRTGTRAIFDVCSIDLDSVALSLLKADVGGDAADLKVSPEVLLDDSLRDLLAETGIGRVWVELHPYLLQRDIRVYLDRITSLSSDVTFYPVVGDPDVAGLILNSYPACRNLALKGSEASGFVGSETTLILYSGVRGLIRRMTDPAKIIVWGGIGCPEAAAAFLAAGAAGIVFESVHWLTDLFGLDQAMSEKISKLRPAHTELTGLNLGVPCRLFNKGNSRAVKGLRDFAGSLCGEEVGDKQRRSFAQRIKQEWMHPLDSDFGRDEVLPLGVEAAFASSFVQRFGRKTEEAIEGFVTEIERICRRAPEIVNSFVRSPAAREMGVKYPFVQGAMSWITDEPKFAAAVAEAGGLPTIALGLMDDAALSERLNRLTETMGDRPFAVNVITLAENPFRELHLSKIKEIKPRFAVIAAGEPSQAAELLEAGIDVIYIAPNEDLMKMAFDVGVRWVVCEGNEAGGHVGEHSTLTLAQTVIELRRLMPDLFEGRRIVLAGGICGRETAFMAAMMGADAIQMGTVYLATKEIVESGALSPLYQRLIVGSSLGGTVVTGEGSGLRVRSLRSPRVEAICELEREFMSGSGEESSFRQQMEHLAAGSLFVAAKGLAGPGGQPLPEAECVERGQFMSGAAAGVLEGVVTLDELHASLAEGPLAVGLPFVGPVRQRPIRVERTDPDGATASTVREQAVRKAGRPAESERIAITGMAMVNALGTSPEEVWDAVLAMKSGIVHVPRTRWDHGIFYDPRPRASEKTYCRVGAFQNVEISRKDLGIPPQDFRTMTESTKITMWLARNAIEESGILDSDIPRERIGVLISQNSGEAAGTLSDVIIRNAVDKIVSAVKTVVPLSAEEERAVEEAVKAGRIAIDDTTLLGRLNCSAAGFICNRYGFQGPSFAVSAACATALVALFSAYQMIRNGILDAAVVGGAEEPLTPMHFLEFSALGALAGLSGRERAPGEYSRPFDAERDGMVLGEGGGMIVIERESVARKRHARIHAYVTSMGAGNNHLGMVESSRITQEQAIRASFDDASYGPEGVDLVECHATSTQQGDVEEVLALKRFYGPDKPVLLTSFKSQIGHTLGASGVNSLIRGVVAANAGVVPPTLNYVTPDPEMELEGSGMSIPNRPEKWRTKDGRPRRFQVDAFGFGGSNYVVQLEQCRAGEDRVLVSPRVHGESGEPVSRLAEIPDGVHLLKTDIYGRPYNLGVVAGTLVEALELVEKAEPLTNGGPINQKRLRSLSRQGIHLGPSDAPRPPLAFVFPGQGSHYAGMSHELYETFPVIREWMDRIANVADFDLLHMMFYDREEDLQKTRWQQPALYTMELAMVKYMISLGISPTAMAGHSLGELTALCLAGVYSPEDGFRLVNMRAKCMDKACDMNQDPGIMMAVDAPRDLIEKRLEGSDNIFITNLNSPRQIVIGGDTEAVRAFGEELKTEGYRRTQLRVSMAFHSPIMRCIHDELDAFVKTLEFHPPRIPVISNTTTRPFPSDTQEIQRIVMAHLESPVHWMDNVRTLWDDFGVRLFVEVGPRDILSNMIQDTIEEAECLQTCLPSAESLMYRMALSRLHAAGHFTTGSSPKFVAFPGQEKAAPESIGTVPQLYAPDRKRAVSAATAPTQPSGGLDAFIRREIDGFVLETFGRFIKPNILSAIRRSYDGNFSESELDRRLKLMFPALPPSAPVSLASSGPVFRGEIAIEPERDDETAVPSPASIPTSSQAEDVTETVIRIIMDATGYERDEISPEM
ncbi:MAG: acyltransferase domain-containing protein, partial [Pseudomonadota bacterium]